jgi:hypothetical protein
VTPQQLIALLALAQPTIAQTQAVTIGAYLYGLLKAAPSGASYLSQLASLGLSQSRAGVFIAYAQSRGAI